MAHAFHSLSVSYFRNLVSCPSQRHYPSQTLFFFFFYLVHTPFICHLMNQPVLSIWTQIFQKAFSETRLMEMPEQTNIQDQTITSDSNEPKGWSVRDFTNYFKDTFNREAQSKDGDVQGLMMVPSLSFQVQTSVLGTMFSVWNTYILYPATWLYFRELTYYRQSLNRDIPQIRIL